jgi:hypothetical protein
MPIRTPTRAALRKIRELALALLAAHRRVTELESSQPRAPAAEFTKAYWARAEALADLCGRYKRAHGAAPHGWDEASADTLREIRAMCTGAPNPPWDRFARLERAIEDLRSKPPEESSNVPTISELKERGFERITARQMKEDWGIGFDEIEPMARRAYELDRIHDDYRIVPSKRKQLWARRKG